MRRSTLFPVIAVLAVGGVSSCRQEDPELTSLGARRNEQQVELDLLKAQLSRLQAEVKAMPADPAPKLEAVARQLAALQAEIPRLDAEATVLGSRRRALQEELDAYRTKYPAP